MKKAISVRFTPEEMALLKKHATKDNRPVSNLINHIVLCYIEEQENCEKMKGEK